MLMCFYSNVSSFGGADYESSPLRMLQIKSDANYWSVYRQEDYFLFVYLAVRVRFFPPYCWRRRRLYVEHANASAIVVTLHSKMTDPTTSPEDHWKVSNANWCCLNLNFYLNRLSRLPRVRSGKCQTLFCTKVVSFGSVTRRHGFVSCAANVS